MEYSRLIYFRSAQMPTIDQVVRALSKVDDVRVSIDDKYTLLYKDEDITYQVGETILVDDGTFSLLIGMTSEPHVVREAEALAQKLLKVTPANTPQDQMLAKLASCDARFEIGTAFPDDLAELFEDHTDTFNAIDERLEALVDGVVVDPDGERLCY